MKWTDKCMLDLAHHNLFEDDGHRRRFHDLLDCYFDKLFFSKGLCKCMYLASWDTEHFLVMLDTLNSTMIEKDFSLTLMRDQGQILEAEAHARGSLEEDEVWKLTNSFMSGQPYDSKGLRVLEISNPDVAYMIKRAILAAALIDELPPLHDHSTI